MATSPDRQLARESGARKFSFDAPAKAGPAARPSGRSSKGKTPETNLMIWRLKKGIRRTIPNLRKSRDPMYAINVRLSIGDERVPSRLCAQATGALASLASGAEWTAPSSPAICHISLTPRGISRNPNFPRILRRASISAAAGCPASAARTSRGFISRQVWRSLDCRKRHRASQ